MTKQEYEATNAELRTADIAELPSSTATASPAVSRTVTAATRNHGRRNGWGDDDATRDYYQSADVAGARRGLWPNSARRGNERPWLYRGR